MMKGTPFLLGNWEVDHQCFGGMSYKVTEYLVKIDGNLNAAGYQNILEENLYSWNVLANSNMKQNTRPSWPVIGYSRMK